MRVLPADILPWLVAGAGLLVGWFARRRLAEAVGESLFASSLSAAIVAGYVPAFAYDSEGFLRTCAVLTGLAVLWHLVARWVERPTAAGATADPANEIRRQVAGHFSLLCGIGLVGICLAQSGGTPRPQRLVLTACLLMLTAIALPGALRLRDAYRRYAVVALPLCALAFWLPLERLTSYQPTLAAVLPVVAAGLLTLALLPDVLYWRHRKRVWRCQPEKLLEPRPGWPVLSGVVLLVAGATALVALLGQPSVIKSVSELMAAGAVLITAHRRREYGIGEFGLLLVCEGIVLIAWRLLSQHPLATAAGCAAAGLYMLWLARFWHQQLHNGTPWTTAGALILPARRLSHAAAVAACAWAVAGTGQPAAPVHTAVTAAVGLVLLAWGLLRDARTPENAFGSWLACPTLLAASVPWYALLHQICQALPWPTILGLLAILLAVLAGRPAQPPALRDRACNAYLGGILTVLLASMALTPGPLCWPSRFLHLVGLPLLLGAWLMRWGRHSVPPDVSAAPQGEQTRTSNSPSPPGF